MLRFGVVLIIKCCCFVWQCWWFWAWPMSRSRLYTIESKAVQSSQTTACCK